MNRNNVYVKNVDKFEMGTFAKCDFRKGEEVMQFYGDQILTERNKYSIQLEENKHLMPSENGGKFVNHSCNPNCGIKNDKILIALRDIKANEEIRFDYAMTETAISQKIKCLCGEKECRGYITGFFELSPNYKIKYKACFSKYINQLFEKSNAL